MIRTRSGRIAVALLPGIAVLGLGGCGSGSGTQVVDAKSAQQSITDAVAKNTNVKASKVKCPDGVEAKVDSTFDCTYTTSKGVDYVAHLKITEIEDDKVLYDITSDPA